MDDVLVNKTETVERCLQRIREEYAGHEEEFMNNHTKQDSVLLNLQRAVQATIDMAMHAIWIRKIRVPQNSRDVFAILVKEKMLDSLTGEKMQKMVGFRNIAVHDCQSLNLDIVIPILENHLEDFREFTAEILSGSEKDA